MNYKHSFDCKHCPQRNDEQGCPCWCELVETNTVTGEERINKKCLFQLLPSILIELIKASNRPAAAIESTRNEMASKLDQGFKLIGSIVQKKLTELPKTN